MPDLAFGQRLVAIEDLLGLKVSMGPSSRSIVVHSRLLVTCFGHADSPARDYQDGLRYGLGSSLCSRFCCQSHSLVDIYSRRFKTLIGQAEPHWKCDGQNDVAAIWVDTSVRLSSHPPPSSLHGMGSEVTGSGICTGKRAMARDAALLGVSRQRMVDIPALDAVVPYIWRPGCAAVARQGVHRISPCSKRNPHYTISYPNI